MVTVRLPFALLLCAAFLPCSAQQKDNSALVTPDLKGLVFLSDAGALKPNGVDVTGIVTDGIEMLNQPSFRNLVACPSDFISGF